MLSTASCTTQAQKACVWLALDWSSGETQVEKMTLKFDSAELAMNFRGPDWVIVR